MAEQNPFGGIFSGKTVLITGHTGFKGSWLSIWLMMMGANVVGYSRDPRIDKKIRNFQLCTLDKKIIKHVIGDIRKLDPLKQAVENYKPELVIHLAAQPLVNIAFQEPERTFDTNVAGTVNIIEAIRQTKSVKAFIGVTTDKVYEDRGREDPRWIWGYRENDLLGGFDPYSASKAMVELAIQSYRRSWREKWEEAGVEKSFSDHHISISSVRAGNVIGGGDFSKYRLVPDCMKALMDQKPIILRNPKSIRPWQHVLEPLGGYLWLAANLLQQTDDKFSDAWNFGPPEHEAVTCESVDRKSIALWGERELPIDVPDTSKEHETNILKLNWVKASTYLDWRPTYNWEQSLKATVDWFREYQRQGGGSTFSPKTVDMHGFCCEQIKQYMSMAFEQGIKWVNP